MPRKPLPVDEALSQTVRARVTQAEADRLEAYAGRRGITKGEAIRDALAMLSLVTPDKDWRAEASEVYAGFSAEPIQTTPASRPTVTPQPFLQTDLVAGQVSLAPSRAGERHLHKFVQVPTTEYFVGGVKQAHFECACGASKSDRVRS